MTPLLAAAREHFTPGFGLHPFEKAVNAFTTAIVRLIGPLHNVPLGEEQCGTRVTQTAPDYSQRPAADASTAAASPQFAMAGMGADPAVTC